MHCNTEYLKQERLHNKNVATAISIWCNHLFYAACKEEIVFVPFSLNEVILIVFNARLMCGLSGIRVSAVPLKNRRVSLG